METREVTQKGNLLTAKLTVTNYNTPFATRTSPEFVISGAALFQVRLIAALVNNGHTSVYNNLLFVRFTKRRDTDDLTYMIYFNIVELNIVGKTFTSDDGTWHLIHENKKQQFTFDVVVEMRLQPSASSFADLHEDTELTDFELRGQDGSVRMHRAVLAAASPVLRRMLGGAWRETSEGHVDVTGTSKATLEHLKNFVYLHVLPESGLEQLLLLSSYYIMPELERLCVDRLVRGVSAGNACDLIEFAAKNNVKRLLLAVLECVQNGAISVTEIRDHLDESEVEAKEVTQKGNFLKAKLTITNDTSYRSIITGTSPEFVISGATLFQVRLNAATQVSNNGRTMVYNNLLFVRFTKRRDSDDLAYKIHFNSVELNIVGKTFTSDDGTWHLIHENKKQQFTFDVAVEMRLQPSTSSFAVLHEDTELTDFELRGEDGSVRMHRAVMAAASPVLRSMLVGEWRDAAEGQVSGTAKATIEHFKKFVYLHVLPESEQDLEQLLLLSSNYIMPELERRCVDRLLDRLLRGVSTENACDLVEFAAKNNMKRLLLAVLECVQNGAISVEEIRDHLDESE